MNTRRLLALLALLGLMSLAFGPLGQDTPPPRPTIRISIGVQTVSEDVFGYCWPVSSEDNQCDFAARAAPINTVQVESGQPITVLIDGGPGAPSAVTATVSNAAGEQAYNLTPAEQTFFEAPLPAGPNQLEIIAVYDNVLGLQAWVSHVFSLDVFVSAGGAEPPIPTQESFIAQTEAPTEPPAIVTEPPAVVTEAPTEPPAVVTEAPTEVMTEAPTEPPVVVTEAPTEVMTEVPTEPPVVVTEAPTEVMTEAPTEPPVVVTEAPTEVMTEAPTEIVTEAPTKIVTEAPTEPPAVVTEAPTEVVTEVATEAVTEAPSDGARPTFTTVPLQVPGGGQEVSQATQPPTQPPAPPPPPPPITQPETIPNMQLVFAGRIFDPVGVNFCQRNETGQTTCVNSPLPSDSPTVELLQNFAVQIRLVDGPRPAGITFSFLDATSLQAVQSEARAGDRLVLFNIDATPGTYFLRVSVNWEATTADYFFKVRVNP